MDAKGVSLDQFRWVARPLVVFADTPNDPAFQLQLRNLAEGADMLRERDVVVIADADPAARTEVRERFRPHGFTFVLVSKDGTIVLRKPIPWGVREISRAIDKLPLRREEMRRSP
ncbi:MAG: DUF4174 domain-containing protein [Alphaproteobacteria bacterium]|nr:MAG: DUF4174 domain-containing protein [Alphaproteobacteria bacterium]